MLRQWTRAQLTQHSGITTPMPTSTSHPQRCDLTSEKHAVVRKNDSQLQMAISGERCPQAEKARRAGGAFQLKKFHNDIKRALINRCWGCCKAALRCLPAHATSRTASCFAACRFAAGKDSLLDLACGRGGDVRKWSDAGVRRECWMPDQRCASGELSIDQDPTSAGHCS